MTIPVAVTVADAMVRYPKICSETTTLGEARRLFTDDHVHAVLIVAGRRLLTLLDRADLASTTDYADDAPAAPLGRLDGRVITPSIPAAVALRRMTADGRRRLAVVDPDGALLGLLCLKRKGTGFCSDDDVRARAANPHTT